MLAKLIEEGYGKKEDFSCAEKILYASNEVYKLGLDRESMKMSAGLAGGLYSDLVCGAVSAGALVLAKLFIRERAHEKPGVSHLVEELISTVEESLGGTSCAFLKERYRKPDVGCTDLVVNIAEILETIIERESSKAV